MHFRLIERPGDTPQEPVTAGQVRAMCRRVLGEAAGVRSAVEMGWGSYNTAFQTATELSSLLWALGG